MRRRLVLAIAGVAAAAVTLFALPLAIVLQRSYRDEELLRLQRDAFADTRGIDLSSRGHDTIELPPDSDRVAIYDPAGRRVAGRGPLRADALVRTVLRTGHPADASGNGRLETTVPLLRRERVTGAVRAQRSDAAVADRVRKAWLLLAALAAGLVLMAVVAAQLLGRRLAAPLVRLAGAAHRLGEGDFAARAPRAGVTEVDEVAQALDATAARLDALVSRERAFSADASHQLRTPLAALRIELEAVQLRGNPPTEIAAALAQVDRLQSTIDTLLAAARDSPDRAATADLTAALNDLERRWHGRLAAAGRPLRTRVLATPALARLSPGVVDEILDVLVENAERHGAGTVTVTLREAGDSPAIDVADEGNGFAGDPEAAFTRRGGSSDGHGIGLALARSLAEAEGGRLVVSNAGDGPVLTLLLASAA